MVTQAHSFMSPLRRKIHWKVLRYAVPGCMIGMIISWLHGGPLEAKVAYYYCFIGHGSIFMYWWYGTAYHQACVDIFLETVQVYIILPDTPRRTMRIRHREK